MTKPSSSVAKGGAKVHKVMKELKKGTLRSGSGKSVTSRKQAVAIALNEAREAGANIPRKGAKPSPARMAGNAGVLPTGDPPSAAW